VVYKARGCRQEGPAWLAVKPTNFSLPAGVPEPAYSLSLRFCREITRRQLPPVERISFILGMYLIAGIKSNAIEKITSAPEWYISQATNGQQMKARL